MPLSPSLPPRTSSRRSRGIASEGGAAAAASDAEDEWARQLTRMRLDRERVAFFKQTFTQNSTVTKLPLTKSLVLPLSCVIILTREWLVGACVGNFGLYLQQVAYSDGNLPLHLGNQF